MTAAEKYTAALEGEVAELTIKVRDLQQRIDYYHAQEDSRVAELKAEGSRVAELKAEIARLTALLQER